MENSTDSALKKRYLWMPLQKDTNGDFQAILSDTSIDRDDEFMTKDLIESWANNNSLPALVNHKNEMQSFVGGWRNLNTVTNKGHTALRATPFFFSKEANPLAPQIEKQIEEAADNGLNPGISIGAIPTDYIEKEVDGKPLRGWTKAELVEATWTPIQSNRNSSYSAIAKSFGLEKPAKVDACVRELMDDSDFKPTEGKTKEESAFAVCQAAQKKNIQDIDEIKKIFMSSTEVTNMADEDKKIEDLEKEVKDLKEKNVELEAKIKKTEEEAKKPDEGAEENADDKGGEGSEGDDKKETVAELTKKIEALDKKLDEKTSRTAMLKSLNDPMNTPEEEGGKKKVDLEKVKPTIANMIAAEKGFDMMEGE